MLLEHVGNGNRNAFERVGGGGGGSLYSSIGLGPANEVELVDI